MARGRTPSKHPPSWSGTFSTSPPCTRYTRVKALDTEACTGLWTFDPEAYEKGPAGTGPSGFRHRGVAH